ncbi:hypothetical protein KC361_g62 [Hortaea werneckii]|nr:hypothetical protein KC361_g62 [Hortaea werneckii]
MPDSACLTMSEHGRGQRNARLGNILSLCPYRGGAYGMSRWCGPGRMRFACSYHSPVPALRGPRARENPSKSRIFVLLAKYWCLTAGPRKHARVARERGVGSFRWSERREKMTNQKVSPIMQALVGLDTNFFSYEVRMRTRDMLIPSETRLFGLGSAARIFDLG